MHVGQAVGHRDRELRFGRALGDARADGVGERELAAQVVGLAGADAEVCADGGDPVLVAQAGAGGPAVAELLLLVGEREVLALVLLGLDAADLVRRSGSWSSSSTIRLRIGVQAVAGERVAGAGGEQPALAGVEDDVAVAGGAVADAGHELAHGHQHAGEPLDRLGVDLAAGVGGELELVERDRARACPPGRRARWW